MMKEVGSSRGVHLRPSSSGKKKWSAEEVDKALKWVIFPDDKWIKRWDLLVLLDLFLLMFILPYQIGVSAGIFLLTRIGWLVFNIILNSIFFVDTFLYFFRAYTTKDGHLMLNPKKIRRRYLRTMFIPNLISVLPFTLAFYFLGREIILYGDDEPASAWNGLHAIQIGNILKLIRLTRVKPILSSSEAISSFRLEHNSQLIQLGKYVFLIIITSHWFACFWSWIAFLQVLSFDDDLSTVPNWIGYWYENNTVDGGLNPIGWFRDKERYVLSLFWSIQSITSIGYGNIVPLTAVEYYMSCFLQLCAGVTWAYVIGGLVAVTAAMQLRAEAFRSRTDEANEMIQKFAPTGSTIDNDDDEDPAEEAAKTIREFLHDQFTMSGGVSWERNLSESYPVFDTLPPSLQRKTSLLIFQPALEIIPYLSSRYLTSKEQALVAMHCSVVEFAAGESVFLDDCGGNPGRGVFVLTRGVAYTLDSHRQASRNGSRVFTTGSAYSNGKVLVEDGNPASNGFIRFLTFSRAIFIPRAAIMDALNRNKSAWKGCARWMYCSILLQQEGTKLETKLETKSSTDTE